MDIVHAVATNPDFSFWKGSGFGLGDFNFLGAELLRQRLWRCEGGSGCIRVTCLVSGSKRGV